MYIFRDLRYVINSIFLEIWTKMPMSIRLGRPSELESFAHEERNTRFIIFTQLEEDL